MNAPFCCLGLFIYSMFSGYLDTSSWFAQGKGNSPLQHCPCLVSRVIFGDFLARNSKITYSIPGWFQALLMNAPNVRLKTVWLRRSFLWGKEAQIQQRSCSGSLAVQEVTQHCHPCWLAWVRLPLPTISSVFVDLLLRRVYVPNGRLMTFYGPRWVIF